MRTLSRLVTRWKIRLISGEPDTLRGVSPVRRGVLGNLPQQCDKAPGTYPTPDLNYRWLRTVLSEKGVNYHGKRQLDHPKSKLRPGYLERAHDGNLDAHHHRPGGLPGRLHVGCCSGY